MSETVPAAAAPAGVAARRMRHVAVAGVLPIFLGGSLVNGILPAHAADAPISQGRPVVASSSERGDLSAAAAVDGNDGTRWSSRFSDPQWLQVDLGKSTAITKVVLKWERAYATHFKILSSADGKSWTTLYATTSGRGGVQTVNVSATGRYVRLYTTKRATPYGVSLWEFQAFGQTSATPAPSATPTKPAPSSNPSTAPATPAPTGPSAASGKKGVGVWKMTGVSEALAKSGASWYYTWSSNHDGITTPKGSEFVPLIWGAGSVTDKTLAEAKSAGPYLLGFNEPDMAEQSNMSVDKALSLWPKLMAAGRVVGSPAVAYGGDRPGGWLDRFMSGAAQRGYRVDFVSLHWYGGDFRTEAAVGQLKSYLQAVYERYHKPIWLTEYALIDFSHGVRFPTEAQQAAFVTASTTMLAGLPYVHRYAWFGLGTSDTGPSSGLFHGNGVATPAGRAFQEAH
ncbi:glycosyl hydrolase [Planotetraspora sp. A-T 1434]|uniref:glycosyl hydrolase n=1 Tax=Planotetraspora sp. A-T 1434 TaxID=2979219 RepID=UPI0021C09C43|nr:glycosyl hydrolase [Planotetraspora sp. A-T 1434]MCT9929576.1 glycosyl hydrolase [Planotetraspora sp. A-T 1434]